MESFFHICVKQAQVIRSPLQCPKGAPRNGRVQAPCGITGIPLTRNCVLDTTTRSPALSPEVME